jgi:2-dehydro-3-deoxyphosphogluconate aldolase/(4S)-4-hydroxy-2-oxoglutarate aldolase
MRFDRNQVLNKIYHPGLLPLFYNDDYELCKNIIKRSYESGIHVFEFTNRGRFALEHFGRLVKELESACPELALGVGTILDENQAHAFADAGASFVVQPIFDPAVGRFCNENNLAWIPGAMTATEVHFAYRSGASIVKIFPGNVLGPGFVKSFRGPFPDIPLMVSGGVEPTVESINSWKNAGVQVCGLGSQLFNPQTDLDTLSTKLKDLIQQLSA